MNDLVKPLTLILGVVLALVGVAGFFMDPLLVFNVNTVHNIVHLASGVVALIAVSMGVSYARMFLIVFGLVYGLVTVLGFMNIAFAVTLLDLNAADNYLHLAIAAVCLVVGFMSKAPSSSGPSMTPSM